MMQAGRQQAYDKLARWIVILFEGDARTEAQHALDLLWSDSQGLVTLMYQVDRVLDKSKKGSLSGLCTEVEHLSLMRWMLDKSKK